MNSREVFKKVKNLIFLTIFFAGILSWADDPYQTMDSEHYARQEGSETTGEKYDARRGDLSFEFPMIKLPGPKGLDINVGISFNKTSTTTSGPRSFRYSWGGDILKQDIITFGAQGGGGWVLEVPRLIGTTYKDFLGCHLDPRVGPMLALPNESSRRFVWYDSVQSPIKNFNYITMDKWGMSCRPEYLVRSPAGLIYRFDPLPLVKLDPPPPMATQQNGYVVPNFPYLNYPDNGPGITQDYVLTATSVEDIYGNWIRYSYDGIKLVKIYANDGRTVTIKWSRISVSSPYGTTIDVPTEISANGKSWKLNYDVCNPGTACFYNPNPTFSAMNQSVILRSISRPDDKSYSFTYYLFRSEAGKDGYQVRPGRNYQIIKMDYPNGLHVDYSYTPVCTSYIDGFRPSTLIGLSDAGQLTESEACSSYMALTSKVLSGPGLATTYYKYSYFVPNFDSDWFAKVRADINLASKGSGGDNVSYSFEFGPTKLKVSKFKRDPRAGDLTDINLPDDPSMNMLIESGLFPLPPDGYEDLPEPPKPPEPPPPPPTVVFTSTQTVYPLGSTITITFATTVGNISTTSCRIDGGTWVPCTTLTSFILPTNLSAGPHKIEVQLKDAAGKVAAIASFDIYIGDPNAAVAPSLVYDLIGVNTLPGQRVVLYAQFTGMVTKYIWYKNGVQIPGSDSYLIIDPVTKNSFAKYKVVAWNQATSKSSSEVKVSLDIATVMSAVNPMLME